MSDVLDSLIDVLLAGKDKLTAGLPVPGKKTLFYYNLVASDIDPSHPGLSGQMFKDYAKYSLDAAEAVSISSLADLTRDLGRRAGMQYDNLYLSCHGTGGQILIGNDLKDLEQIVSGWTQPGVKLPKVTRLIALEGCDIGQKTESMLAFSKVFGAQQVSAWTKLHGWGYKAFPMPSGPNEAARRTAFMSIAGPYGPYLLPNHPSLDDIFASTRPGGQAILSYEWFAEESNTEHLGDAIASTEPAFLDVKFYPRSKATNKYINSRAAALNFDSGQDGSEPTGDATSLFHVFVRLPTPASP